MSYQQTIYNRLRQGGISEAGALGLLGNFECESSCEPYRIQGDFSPYRTNSKAYVQSVMNGSVSKSQFCDGRVGKFIAQWTYPTRQGALWDFWKKRGGAIDDVVMQTDFVLEELKGYSGLLAFLKSTTDVFTAVSRVCREYERPAVNNIDARFSAAKRIQNEIDLDAWQSGDDPAPEPQPTPEPKVDHSLKLRVTDEHCYGWAEAHLVQALLICRGYNLHVVTGVWDDEDIEAVKDFQRECGLTADGIVGKKTWERLFNA